MSEKLSNISQELFKRFCIVVVFGIALGYFEAAVVVYLRAIFHPDGFTFPMTEFGVTPLWKQILFTEVGREAASMLLIFSAAWLFGQNYRQRSAFFATIFAVWDIFYYIWLKILIDWPSSIVDWDILFLIPTAWAGPVLAPVLISITLLIFAVIILYHSYPPRAIKATSADWFGFLLAGLIVVVSFCIAGQHIAEPDYKSHFSWLLFALGEILAIALFAKCLLKSK